MGWRSFARGAGPNPLIRAVGAHAAYTGIQPEAPMERAIVAADELSGFVGACALIRPSKSVRDLPPESVLKRMKDKAFARAVDRGEIRRGAEAVGLPLLELAALVIAAQVPIADRLGVGGNPAPDLPDAPVPSAPPSRPSRRRSAACPSGRLPRRTSFRALRPSIRHNAPPLGGPSEGGSAMSRVQVQVGSDEPGRPAPLPHGRPVRGRGRGAHAPHGRPVRPYRPAPLAARSSTSRRS